MLIWNEIIERIFSLFPEMSQTEIGDALGVSQDTVSRWYTGKAKPGWDHIHDIAEKSGKSEEWILLGTSIPAPAKVDGGLDQEPIDIVLNLQRSLSGFQLILAETGHYLAAGRSLKTYRDLPSLISTIRKLKDLCEAILKRLESYRQNDENQNRPA